MKKNRCVYKEMVKQVQMRNFTGSSEEFLTCESQLNLARDRILCKSQVMQEYQVIQAIVKAQSPENQCFCECKAFFVDLMEVADVFENSRKLGLPRNNLKRSGKASVN